MTTASLTFQNIRGEESVNGKKIAPNDQSRALIESTAAINSAKTHKDATEFMADKMAKPVSSIPDEPVPIDDSKEGQSAPVEVTTVNSPKLHSSCRPNPSAPSALGERQRTHTVMTVDQNLRAGINAYLEGIGGGQQTHHIIKVIKCEIKKLRTTF
jgi:hypothetical protein